MWDSRIILDLRVRIMLRSSKRRKARMAEISQDSKEESDDAT